MLIENRYLIVLIFFFIFPNLSASEKSKIIYNLSNVETLKFDFIQISLNKKEEGNCYLKRPHFLKCVYNDKKQKELFINRNNIVIYHREFKKKYYYPASKSFFKDILNKKKFQTLILNGKIKSNENFLEIMFFDKNKGEIKIFFDKENYDIFGWETNDLNNNYTSFELHNIVKNENLDTKLFNIPEIN